MAVDVFLKIEGVKGESQDHAHKEEIDVLSWDWGMSQAGSTHVAMGSGAGKVEVRDLTVVKYVDKATPNLMMKCCNGKHYPEAVLTLRKAGEVPLEYLKITMTDLMVTNIESGSAAGHDRLTETVSLNFAKVKIEYTPQNPDGSGQAAIEAGWDIAANTEL